MDSKRSKSSQKSPAETITGNDDLLTEGILLRLPAKSLVRFQLVCKHWRSLILARSFCRVHTRRSIQSGGGGRAFIFTPSASDVIHFNPVAKAIHKFQFPHTSCVRILQSSNGLWLLELDGGKRYSVHNPTTKQSRLLELTPRAAAAADRQATCLAFDPSNSIHYKVFFIYSEGEKEKQMCRFRVETFDSETDEWTSVYYPSAAATFRRPEQYDWIYLNNKLYSMPFLTVSLRAYYLDLQTGNVLPLPKIYLADHKPRSALNTSRWDFPSHYHFTGSNGRLRCALIANYSDDNLITIYYDDDNNYNTLPLQRCLFLFELKEDNSGWLQLCKVNIHLILQGVDIRTRKVGVDVRRRKVRVIRGADQREGHVLLHVEGGMVISYRLCDGNFELVLDSETVRETRRDDLMSIMIAPPIGCNKLFPFIESLAPV